MKLRSVPVLDRATLETKSTRELVSRLRVLQRCEDEPALSDRSPAELAEAEGIVFKQSEEWRRAHADVTAVLAGREHVPRAQERRAARQRRAQAGRRSGRRDR